MSLNEDAFENINTEEQAYWLGWMLSDGFITIRKGNKQPLIGLKLKASDKEVLIKLKDFWNTPNKIELTSEYALLRVHSQKMVNDLAKYTVTPRKSHTTRLPILKEDLMPHLLRGILDGDGWICRHEIKPNKIKYSIGWCSASLITNDIMLYLNKTLNLPILKTSKKTWQGNQFYQLEYQSQKDCIKLFHYLYDNASIYLERKYIKTQGNPEVTI